MTSLSDKGTWTCNDKWTTYPAASDTPAAPTDGSAAMPADGSATASADSSTMTPVAPATANWKISNTQDDI